MQPALSQSGVSLDEMLIARDERAARQLAARTQFGAPLVSITLVTPGPVKDGWLPRHVMKVALEEMDLLIDARNWPLLSREVFWRITGPEAIYVVDVEAQILKSAAIGLEERHPIGRLWDLDVITATGMGLSRTQRSRPARPCLACDRPAHECARSRRHSLPELMKHIRSMVNHFDLHARS
jgi:holo-ACP synthase